MTPNPKKTRRARDRRHPQSGGIQLTERDRNILWAVADYRLLTAQQLQTLFFPSLHQTYARLVKLYDHGYLERVFLGQQADKMNQPILYALGKAGKQVLEAEQGEALQVRAGALVRTPTFLRHTLAINSVRVAIHKACENGECRLLAWLDEADLKANYDRVRIRNRQDRLISVSVIPDGYFRLETPRGVTHCVLELDNATETLSRYQQKLLAYQHYYDSGGYERRFGTRSLRVLTVTTGRKVRCRNLCATAESIGGRLLYWFTTFDQITPDTILYTPIWQVPSGDELLALV